MPHAESPGADRPGYVVAVRALCEFSARAGDLDLRFMPSPSAQEGQAGHAVVTARRPAGYQTEIALSGTHGHLRVRGRADGYDPVRHRVEEIKTHRGDPAAIPRNQRALHWAQVRIYGHLLCQKLQCDGIELALVYFDIATQRETVLTEPGGAAELRTFFEAACDKFSSWAAQELVHRDARDRWLGALRFPHPTFRPGQRDMSKAVYRAARDGGCLMAQAPTGIGKTMASVFGALKAAPTQLDKVFFLCAKTAGRQLALQALAQLRAAQAEQPLRALELLAKDQACVHPDKACHGESCPLARGFHDRLGDAREAALARPVWDRAAVHDIARAHEICPYFLAQELARWSDVVIGDYHYYFDHNGMLHGLATAYQWRIAVLVDEAHNLLERGRRMYTAELCLSDIRRLCKDTSGVLPRHFAAIARAWRVAVAPPAQAAPETPDAPAGAGPTVYRTLAEPPASLMNALEQAVAAIADHLAGLGAPLQARTRRGRTGVLPIEQPDGDAPDPDRLLRFYFDALRFIRIAEQYDSNSIVDVASHVAPAREQVLCVRNVVPAPFLAPRFAAAHASVLFSATLAPTRFYADTLGLPAHCGVLDVPPAFDPTRLTVHVVDHVSTRYAERERSLDPIADLIARQYAGQPGNYLCFASSFEYLDGLFHRLRARHPGVPAWTQTAEMDDMQRLAFLDRFQADGKGIGYAVLGGAFGEGIDLPGNRLIGAFIVTLGLPQVSRVNEQIMRRMHDRFGMGYEYAYLYPGLQKVVQAAGRVIRSETDEGSIYLIDPRFHRPAVRRLLPAWWRVRRLAAPH
jgi:DNA excision repair protein ERCC-2